MKAVSHRCEAVPWQHFTCTVSTKVPNKMRRPPSLWNELPFCDEKCGLSLCLLPWHLGGSAWWFGEPVVPKPFLLLVGLNALTQQTWPLSFSSIGFMVAVKKSQVWVITFKERAVIAHPFHTEDLSFLPQSSKMLHRMRSENGSKVDLVFVSGGRQKRNLCAS